MVHSTQLPLATSDASPTAMSEIAPRSLRHNMSWTLLGNVVLGGCQWGTLVLLARLGSPEIVGQYSLSVAIVAPLLALASLHLRSVQATDARHEYQFSDYFALRLATTALAGFVIAGVALLGSFSFDAKVILIAVGFAAICDSIADIVHGLLQKHERMDRIAWLQMTTGILRLGIVGLVATITGSLIWGLVAAALGAAWRLIFSDFPAARRIVGQGGMKPRWRLSIMGRLAWTALPMGMSMIFASLYINVPRYWLELAWGSRELGLYAALAQFVLAARMVNQAITNTVIPRLAKLYAKGDYAELGRIWFKLLWLGTAAAALGFGVAAIVGKDLLRIIYGAEYAQEYNAFLLLAGATGVTCGSFSFVCVIAAQRMFRARLLIQLVNLAVVTLASWLLVERHGITGAATAVLIAAVASFALHGLVALYAYFKPPLQPVMSRPVA